MRYFRLIDDVYVPNRWHVEDVVAMNGPVPSIDNIRRLEDGVRLSARVAHKGKPLDFCLTSFGIPVAKQALANGVAAVAGTDVQAAPIAIVGAPPHEKFSVLHCLRSIECLDETRSDFLKWTTEDHRPELAGQYRMVINLSVDPTMVPPNANFFRISRWCVALVVSDVVKQAIERSACLGAKFVEVG